MQLIVGKAILIYDKNGKTLSFRSNCCDYNGILFKRRPSRLCLPIFSFFGARFYENNLLDI
jgi:hypothetical protein